MPVLQGINRNKNIQNARCGVFFTIGIGLVCLLLPLAVTAAEDSDLCASSSDTAWSEENPCSLQPPDTSSPRATLKSFMYYTSNGVEAYRNGKETTVILSWFQRAESCLDLSDVSPDRTRVVATEAGLLLYEVLNRVGLPDYSTIPDKQKAKTDNINVWKVPHTDIAIARVKEGERTGEFLFSPRTVANALAFYSKVKNLPHHTNYSVGTYEQYVTRPDFGIPYLWADKLPEWANVRLYRNPIWKWLAILTLMVLGVALAYLVYRIGRTWDERFKKLGGKWGTGNLVFAVSLVIIPIIIINLLTNVIGVRFQLNAIISKVFLTIAFIAAVYTLFMLIEFIARIIISSNRLRVSSVNAQFVKVTGRLLGIVVSIFFVIEASEFLGFKLAPVLAGLGIGGLAVALAARPTLENIIGGFTLFADKPVQVGDYCRFGDQKGTVEEIGLRSTRLRKRDDTLISVPNADFSQIQLHNLTRRRHRNYWPTIGLRYETTPDQLRYVIARLREMLISHPGVLSETLFVRFKGFGAYSLDLELFANLKTQDWLEYRAIREDINLRIMDIVKEAGTGFAFPSQTNYFARDTGLDTERGQEAEEKVEFWRARRKLPFPEFGEEDQERLEGTLEYPPKGSPDHTARETASDDKLDPQVKKNPESK